MKGERKVELSVFFQQQKKREKKRGEKKHSDCRFQSGVITNSTTVRPVHPQIRPLLLADT